MAENGPRAPPIPYKVKYMVRYCIVLRKKYFFSQKKKYFPPLAHPGPLRQGRVLCTPTGG